MKKEMDATIVRVPKRGDGTTLLLRHCLSAGWAEHRTPARRRLEEAVGPEFARRLVTSLLAQRRT